MSTLLIIFAGFIGLMAGMQILVRLRVRALRGKPAPVVGGVLGKRIAAGQNALVYFHSPGCGACRPFTPLLTNASRKNPAVHVIDVAQQMDVARAFGVMATPSTVEVEGGRILDYRVGPLPRELLARYGV